MKQPGIDEVEPPTRYRDAEPSTEQSAQDSGLAKLAETLDRRGAEIDNIQIELAKKSKPFYKEPATIIAILALVASVVATVISQYSSTRDRIDEQRGRLTTVVQSLGEGGGLQESQDGDAIRSVALIRPALNEASFLIAALETTELRSTPYEKIVVAVSYTYANEPGIAAELAAQAEAQAQAEDGVLSERWDAAVTSGRALFWSNRLEEGRNAFRRALDHVANQSANYDSQYLAAYAYQAQESWSYAELRANRCDEAKRHSNEARAALNGFPVTGPGAWAEREQVLRQAVATPCGAY